MKIKKEKEKINQINQSKKAVFKNKSNTIAIDNPKPIDKGQLKNRNRRGTVMNQKITVQLKTNQKLKIKENQI